MKKYLLTEEELTKYTRINYCYVALRKSRKEYEVYNELTGKYVIFNSNDQEEVINHFNKSVDENIEKLNK